MIEKEKFVELKDFQINGFIRNTDHLEGKTFSGYMKNGKKHGLLTVQY